VKHSWQMLSLSSVLRRSKNFTSSGAIRMPPAVPLNHGPGSENPQNRTGVLFHYSKLLYSGVLRPALNTLMFSQSTLRDRSDTQLRASGERRETGVRDRR